MIDKIALLLSIVGGINWGLMGLFNFDVVAWLCGSQTSVISRIIYIVIAVSSIWCISILFKETESDA